MRFQTIPFKYILSFIGTILLLLCCGCNLSSSQPLSSYNESSQTPDSQISSLENYSSTLESSQEDIAETTSTMEVHFLDVGQGLSILSISEDDVLLYDGGDRDSSSFVVAYLKSLGITTIDYLISSHYDSDHLSGLIGCLYAFEIENVIAANYKHNSSLYTSFHNAVTNQGLTITYPQVGDTFEFGSGRFTVLSPATTYHDSNNNSVTIKLSNGNHDFLFMGDAELDSESDIVSSGIDLSCDVICAGHHGSASSTSWDLLQASVPEYAVISCGIENSHGHPHEETMEKFQSMEIPIFRTDLQGTIIATSDGNHITWNKQPCENYSRGYETSIEDILIPKAEVILPEPTYILNIRSNIFHSTNCDSLESMNEKNKQNLYDTREQIIEMGYKPCGNCNP